MDREVSEGEVFAESHGKTGFPGLRFFRRRLNCAWRGEDGSRTAKLQLGGSKEGGLEYTGWKPGAKMEIPAHHLGVKNFPKTSLSPQAVFRSVYQ
jgi:hypothetical protein